MIWLKLKLLLSLLRSLEIAEGVQYDDLSSNVKTLK